MAKNDFPKVKAAEAYPLGHAKENKDASAYTGDRKSTRLNSSHSQQSRMPSSA